ncbi:protein turtle [Galendromus occidentalis]|uniref:Protein turtle n=1 Tax=Galendromus occidentalis TaxID=34638 RepID=A0AAJ7SHK3_9ACAR|nr:protein turtle [Galendromus occidentalis]
MNRLWPLAALMVVVTSGVFSAPPKGADGKLHKTSTIGDNVILECPFEYPNDTPVPYLVQWHKDDHRIPIYIWYESYPPHASDEYKDRVSLSDKTSLNLTSVRVSDKGWYECTVFFINREEAKNGSWIYLDVLAPPHFKTKPPETVFVREGETIVLQCKAQGTPTPTVTWQKEHVPIEATREDGNVQITEHQLRISNIKESDTGSYQCVARNSQGAMEVRSRVMIAGPARINTKPSNITVTENNVAELKCEAQAQPANFTHKWLYNNVEISGLTWLKTRTMERQDGALFITQTHADDSGLYTCVVSNGIGEPESASAYVNIEFPAKVNFTPNFQYMPLHLPGMVKCFIVSNPPLQFVTWFKDKKPFEPSNMNGVRVLANGTLHFDNVSKEHEGSYMCSPFNIHGTGGASKLMEVLVREPPVFSVKPKEIYQQPKNGDITFVCEGKGQPMPTINWRRADGKPLPKQRFSISQEIVKTVSSGNLTLKSIQKEDHGHYECILQNEVATLVTSSLLLVESTTPHAPTNVSVITDSSSATVSWLPGFDGGHEQSYVLWYRLEVKAEDKELEWRTIRVHPTNVTSITIHNLQPETTYEFQVQSRNEVGDGFFSERVLANTAKPGENHGATEDFVATHAPTATQTDNRETSAAVPEEVSEPTWHVAFSSEPPSPTPDVPLHVNILPPTEVGKELLVSWKVPPPSNHSAPLTHFNVEYKQDISHAWTKSAHNVHADPNQSLMQYHMNEYPREAKVLLVRVVAYSSLGTTNASPLLNVTVRNDTGHLSQKYRRDRAIISGVMGGILFFFVAIILSVCAVKICNKRRRRKAEKTYMMVTCGSLSSQQQSQQQQQQQNSYQSHQQQNSVQQSSRGGMNSLECTHGSHGTITIKR